jgi:hypothetical protein
MTTAPTVETLADLAEQVLNDASRELALGSADMTQGVRDAAGDYRSAVSDVLAAGRQAAADLRELGQKRDLLPAQGAERLRNEAIAEASERSADADRRAARAYAKLEAELQAAALPKLNPAREQLARDELREALGDAQGARAITQALDVVRGGSYEAAAALFTTYGSTLLKARGVANPEADLAPVRKVAAAEATSRGKTPGELIAGAAYGRLGKLGAARGAAGSYTLKAIAGRA